MPAPTDLSALVQKRESMLRMPAWTYGTEEQIEMCRHLWARLYEEMDFRVASLCPVLLPHGQEILAPIVENIPA
jgi:hypothetical protein